MITGPDPEKPDRSAPPLIHVQILEIPELIRMLMTRSLPEDYLTCRAFHFEPEHFARPFLDREEFQRLNRFKALKKQVEWACGRYCAKFLARRVLMPGQGAKGKLDRIQINYMEQGAPYLVAFPGHCLSLSHSGTYTAAALAETEDRIIGIDIEAIARRPDHAFMKTAFTAREISAMGKETRDIFRCWTLKEAYLKYIRKGFNESLHRVEIIGDDIFHNGRKQNLVCRSLTLESDLNSGYIMGIVHDPGADIRFLDPAPF